jgi:6-pyruvoyltetrahydropterin/6-carboxytetrahydropterin synthase
MATATSARLDLAELYEALDHRYLNNVEGMDNSTVEFIAQWVWRWAARRGHSPTVVVIQETYTARCIYRA